MNLCKYGCGRIGKFQDTYGEWRCSEYYQQCPVKREETSIISKKSHNIKEYKKKCRLNTLQQLEEELPEDKKKRILKMKTTLNLPEKINESRQNSISLWKDPEYCQKTLIPMRKSRKSKRYRLKQKKAAIQRFLNETEKEREERKLAVKIGTRKRFENETEEQVKIRKISHKRTIEKIKEKHPIFSKEEELRYNPKNLEEKEIQVHCKFSGCIHSKENSGWFTPTTRQIEMRMYAMEHPDGNDGSFIYCSDECKTKCCLFNLYSDPYRKNEYVRYVDEVYKETRRTINLYRDKIKNLHKRGNGYDLDHKFSIFDGFHNGVEPNIVGHYCNLEIIKSPLNRAKNKNSSISIEQLLEEISNASQ